LVSRIFLKVSIDVIKSQGKGNCKCVDDGDQKDYNIPIELERIVGSDEHFDFIGRICFQILLIFFLYHDQRLRHFVILRHIFQFLAFL
jgi:hypothetical protein